MERTGTCATILFAVPAAIILMAACDGATERDSASPKAANSERSDATEVAVSAGPPPSSQGVGPAIAVDKQDSRSDSERRAIEAERAAFEASEAWSSEVLGFALRGDSSPLGPYQLTEPQIGEPLQLEFVMVTARPDQTYFVVRMRNVGDVPLRGYFRLVCSTSSSRTGVTVEPKGLARGRTIHQDLFIRGESTTQGRCALQQEDDWRRYEPN